MVMRIKKITPLLCIFVEILIFFGYYLFSVHGRYRITQLKKENSVLAQTLCDMRVQCEQSKHTAADVQQYPFYLEQIAREQLQLTLPGEHVFYLVNH